MNINQIMKQAQQMQEKMADVQNKMAVVLVEGTSGGGLVKATLSGKGEMKKLTLDPSLINADDKEMLEDLIVAAVNDARHKSDTQMADEMSKLTGGMQLPAGMKMPF